METLPVEVHYCVLDELSEVYPRSVLALSKTCRQLDALVERWLATKKGGCPLFREYVVRKRVVPFLVSVVEVAYLASRPRCESPFCP
jgi:hypothetical protein